MGATHRPLVVDTRAMARKKLRVGVLFGGKSGEHEISLRSARSILKAIDRKKLDVVPIGITKDGRWLAAGDANNLLEGMHVESLPGGIRVSVETSALVPLARFVVRLGDAARPETPALAQMIVELARGALEQAEGVLREGKNARPSEDMASGPARPRSDV